MPELPEVETVKRGLEQVLPGKCVQTVTLRRKDLRIPFPENLAEALQGKRVRQIERRAKYLLWHMEDGQSVLLHLGMSGRITVEKPGYAPKPHDHALFALEDGGLVVFHDPRRFGLITLCTKDELPGHALLVHLGVEPLEGGFNGAWLYDATREKETPIKHFLMDAKQVVGVGNIYASESLFRAGIRPQRKAGSITRKEAEKLAEAVRIVLEAAIASGGSTLRDYVRASGETGYFQHHFAVYGKADTPCENCHHPIQKIEQAGRSSFYCGSCQR